MENTPQPYEPRLGSWSARPVRSDAAFLRALLCMTIVASTFQKTFWYVGGFRVLLSDVLMSGFCLCYCTERLWRRTPPPTSAGSGFVLASLPYLMAMLLSGLVNALLTLHVGLFSKGVITILMQICFQVTAIKLISETTDRKQIYYPLSFAAGAFTSACYAALQPYLIMTRGVDLDTALLERIFGPVWHEGIAEFGSFYRVSGLLADPNHLGYVLVTALAILTSLWCTHDIHERKVTRLALLMITLSLFLALIFTFSRSAFLAAGVMFVVFWRLSGLRSGLRSSLMPLVVSFLLMGGILFFYQREALADVFASKVDTDTEGMHTREDLYRRAPSMWADNLASILCGVGPNNFSYAYEREFGETGWNPHNSWMTELVEGGLLGFIGYLGLVAYVMRCSYLSIISGQRYQIGLAYFAALAGMLAAGLFYDIFHWNYIVALQALAVGLRERQVSSAGGNSGGTRLTPRIA
jgi:hypothetical protein